MKSGFLHLAKNWAMAFLYPKPLIGILYLPKFFKDWLTYSSLIKSEIVHFKDTYPCLTDRVKHTPFDAHYFYQGTWLARKLAESKPAMHVDIGSSVMTIGALSANVDTLFVDYRPLVVNLPGLSSLSANITCLPFASTAIESLSCLHVIEHVGLGRYGDSIDPEGSVKAANELQRILKPGGRLYLSVPIGWERVCFNAHRVFSPDSVSKLFSQLRLTEFAYVDDHGVFIENQSLDAARNLDYGCGMFTFEKPINFKR